MGERVSNLLQIAVIRKVRMVNYKFLCRKQGNFMKSLLFAADARGEGGRDFDDNEEFEDGGETADVNWHPLHL